MSTETYTVTGMTCGHCVSSVTEEVSELPGVDRRPGRPRQRPRSPSPPTQPRRRDRVRAAVEEAGYPLVGEPAPHERPT